MSGDVNADGFVWSESLRQWIPDPDAPVTGGGGGSGTELIAYSFFHDPDGVGLGDSSPTRLAVTMPLLEELGVSASDVRDFGLDEYNGDPGLYIDEPGWLELHMYATVYRADKSLGNWTNGAARVAIYDANPDVLTLIELRGECTPGTSTYMRVGVQARVYIDPSDWVVDPAYPETSTHNVCLGLTIDAPNNTVQLLEIEKFYFVAAFTPAS